MQKTSRGIYMEQRCDKDGVPDIVQHISFGDWPGESPVSVVYFDGNVRIIHWHIIMQSMGQSLPKHLYLESYMETAYKIAEQAWKPPKDRHAPA